MTARDELTNSELTPREVLLKAIAGYSPSKHWAAKDVHGAIDALITATRADERAKMEREIVRDLDDAMGALEEYDLEHEPLSKFRHRVVTGDYRKGDGDE